MTGIFRNSQVRYSLQSTIKKIDNFIAGTIMRENIISQRHGAWAGRKAVNDLFGKPFKAYIHIGYNTCLDLDADALLIPDGGDRVIKYCISTELIYSEKDVEVRWSGSGHRPLSIK